MHRLILKEVCFLALAVALLGGVSFFLLKVIPQENASITVITAQTQALDLLQDKASLLFKAHTTVFPLLKKCYGSSEGAVQPALRVRAFLKEKSSLHSTMHITSCVYRRLSETRVPLEAPLTIRDALQITLQTPEPENIHTLIEEGLGESAPGGRLLYAHLRAPSGSEEGVHAVLKMTYETPELPPSFQDFLQHTADQITADIPPSSESLKYFMYHSKHQWILKFGGVTMTSHVAHPHWCTEEISATQVTLRHLPSGKIFSWSF